MPEELGVARGAGSRQSSWESPGELGVAGGVWVSLLGRWIEVVLLLSGDKVFSREHLRVPFRVRWAFREKALYGCIESSKLWYDNLSSKLLSLGFVKIEIDHCVFNVRHTKEDQLIVEVYVDDLFCLLFCRLFRVGMDYQRVN